jgi:hypothetical protein
MGVCSKGGLFTGLQRWISAEIRRTADGRDNHTNGREGFHD